MIIPTFFSGETVMVLGLGRSGTSAARSLKAGGAKVYAWDDNAHNRSKAASTGIFLHKPTLTEWPAIRALVLSPGIPHTYPSPHPLVAQARQAGIPIISDIDLLRETEDRATYVGVTGTNGKSTSTMLIYHILSQSHASVQVGGNIGIPVLELEPQRGGGIYILEMSSYQLEISRPGGFDVAILLNITPDHLTRHGGFKNYVAAKKRILDKLQGGQTLIIGVDDAPCEKIYRAVRERLPVIPISSRKVVKGGVYVENGQLIDDLEGHQEVVLSLSSLPALPGLHNAQNIAAAYGAVRQLGRTKEQFVRAVQSFQGLAHRQEQVATVDGVRYVNDSKATSAVAVAQAFACYDDIFWICGGRQKTDGLKGLNFERVKHAFVVGEAMATFAATLEKKLPVTRSGDIETAVMQAREAALAKGSATAVVLLSPACESFDQFSDYVARGECFRRCVKNLPGYHATSCHPELVSG